MWHPKRHFCLILSSSNGRHRHTSTPKASYLPASIQRIEALSEAKSSLQTQLESFLWSLPERKVIATASPRNVVDFLIWRDKFGKTIMHSNDCESRTNKETCKCSRGLAAGTIDNDIGKLKTIFKDNGRGSSWNEDLHLGNPASHFSVKEYHSLILEEQTIARVFPAQATPFFYRSKTTLKCQNRYISMYQPQLRRTLGHLVSTAAATPLFMDKLVDVCNHLKQCMAKSGDKPSILYALGRDLAFFSIDFSSGDRGSDLGRVKASDVLVSPGNNGYVFNQLFGKTLRGNGSNVFAIIKVQGCSACPVKNLETYLSLSSRMSIDLGKGYLFCTTDRHGNITENAFTGSAVANRLKKYMKTLSILEGETMHSLRSGCSVTLALLGVPYSEIARHVGWKSVTMALYYTQCEKVFSPNGAASVLADSSSTNAMLLGNNFGKRNTLDGFQPILK